MEQEYIDAMHTLNRQYYEHEITRQIYISKRKLLVDLMDSDFNGERSLKNVGHELTLAEIINPTK